MKVVAIIMLIFAAIAGSIISPIIRRFQLRTGRYADNPSAFKIVGLIISAACFMGYTMSLLLWPGAVRYTLDSWLGAVLPIIVALPLMAVYFLTSHGKRSSVLPAIVFLLLWLPDLRYILVTRFGSLATTQIWPYICIMFSSSSLLLGTMVMLVSGSKRHSRIYLIIGLFFMVLRFANSISSVMSHLDNHTLEWMLKTRVGFKTLLTVFQNLSIMTFCGMLIVYLFTGQQSAPTATITEYATVPPMPQVPVAEIPVPAMPEVPVAPVPQAVPAPEAPVMQHAFCPYCGKPRTPDQAFCQYCGGRLN